MIVSQGPVSPERRGQAAGGRGGWSGSLALGGGSWGRRRWRQGEVSWVLRAPSSSQPEPESLGPVTPGFPEQEEDELHRTLGVERFEEILQEAGSRGGEEPGRSYGEEDFECEGGREAGPRGRQGCSGLMAWRVGPGAGQLGREAVPAGSQDPSSLQTTASPPTTSTTHCPPTCLRTPGAERQPRAQAGSRAGALEPPPPGRPLPSRRARKRKMRPVRLRGPGPSPSRPLPLHPLQCR